MRSLTVHELESVGGAGFISTVEESTKFGATVGGVAGFVMTGTPAGAAYFGLVGGAYGFAWGVGFGIGTALYEWACG